MGINDIATQVADQNPTLDKLVDNISHIADLVGVEHVGLGLDFVKDDGPLHPDDELFNAGANKLLPDLESEERSFESHRQTDQTGVHRRRDFEATRSELSAHAEHRARKARAIAAQTSASESSVSLL